MKLPISFLLFFLLLPVWSRAQSSLDSTAIVKQVDSLIQVSRGLTDKREMDKAMEVNEAAERTASEKLGRKTAAYARTCNNHGRILHRKRDYPGAEKWWLEAKTIVETNFGKEHPDYLKHIYSLANLYSDIRDYKTAEPLHLEVRAILEKTTGKETDAYASCLFNLGNLYYSIHDYGKAEAFHLESLSIREKVLGKQHRFYGHSLNSLGILYQEMGEYEKAEPFFIEAGMVQEKNQGKISADYARTLNNLGALYNNMARYEKASSVLLECLSIREKVLGKDAPEYFATLSNLGNVYLWMGDFELAERYQTEAKNGREKILGKDAPDYARSISNLGNLYYNMGNFDKAETLWLETSALQGKTLNREDPEMITSLNGLSSIYADQGKYGKAKDFCFQVMEILEHKVGKEHPDYAAILHNLAVIYQEMGEYILSEQTHLETQTIIEKALGKENPDYAESLFGLSRIYYKTGDYSKCEPYCLEAKAILEKGFNKDRPVYTKILQDLSILYAHTARPNQAAALYDTTSTLQQTQLAKALHHLSERELQNYQKLLSGNQNRALSLAQNYPPAAPTAYNNALFHKGFLLNAYNQVKRLALTDSATTEQLNLLKSYQRRLAAEYAEPIIERKNVPELEEKANTLEKELTRNVAGYGEAMQQVKWQEVQQRLKPGEAAIEFVHYQLYRKKETDSTMYAALLIRPEWTQPRMVTLFEQRDIQPLLAAANTAAAAGQLYTARGNKNSKKATRGDRGEGIVIPGQKKPNLYQLVWARVDSLLSAAPTHAGMEKVSTVYYAPSGILHRLNLGAIPIPGSDQTLADQYALVQLGSTRSLVVAPPGAQDGRNKLPATATLFGGLRYDAEKVATLPDSAAAAKPAYDVAHLRSALGGRGGDAWNYLPGTEKEVKIAAATLNKAGYSVRSLSNYDGTEAAFKMLGKRGNPAPTVLHIATHGFFFPDPKDTTQHYTAFSDRDPVFKTSDNPLLRAGLILTGANPAWAGSKTPAGQEDGILTAYEISQMNLSGTELVVLSACETGLGDVEDNEGVYGLQRAFKIAGAKYLIMSLWQVPDQQTQKLMSAFYQNWLERKMSIPKAFAAAQHTMREQYADPFFWAGFVLVE